jgi:peroxiredoxin
MDVTSMFVKNQQDENSHAGYILKLNLSRMKKLLFIALAITMLAACGNQKNFKITGNINGVDTSSVIVLNKVDKGMPIALDTVKIKDGKFVFEVDTISPQLLVITFGNKHQPFYLFGGNGDVVIEGKAEEMDKAEVTGGCKETVLFYNFNKNVPGAERMQKLMEEGSRAQMTGDTAKLSSLKSEYQMLMDEQLSYVKSFLQKNTDNAVGALICRGMIKQYSLEELKGFISKFDSAKMGSHMYVLELKEAIEPLEKLDAAQKATEIGQAAPQFILKSDKGTEVKLESFKGKYVLVDFWASWCSPCRQENPNTVKAYAKYNSKGFEILSVSVDREEKSWLDAVKEDKLTWTQVRDGENNVAELYAIQSIPATFLLDKDGIIIAKDLRGDELTKKLDELLK